MKLTILLATITLVSLAGFAAPEEKREPERPVLNDTVKLTNGDRLSYLVVEENRKPILLHITDSGEIEVPLVGRVKATGKTCRQFASEIKSILEKEYFKRATVIIGLVK